MTGRFITLALALVVTSTVAAGADSPKLSLAQVYDLENQGEKKKAEKLMKQTLAEARSIYDASDADLYTILQSAAAFYQRRSDYGRARGILLDALGLAESVTPPDPANVRNAHAALCRLMPRLNKAELALTHCILAAAAASQISLELHASDRIAEADAYLRLGETAESARAMSEAVSLLEQAYAAIEQADDPDPLDMSSVGLQLAGAYVRIGEDPMAEALFQRTIEILQENSGTQNPFYVSSVRGYAELLRRNGRSAEAARVEAPLAAKP